MLTRFGIILLSVILTLACVEGGAQLYLKLRGIDHFQKFPRLTAPPPSEFERPESLSAFPIVQQAEGWSYENTVLENTVYNNEGELWIPPRSTAQLVDVIHIPTQESIRQVQVTTDQHARRIPPWHIDRLHTAQRHIAVFGCSVVWGYGVSDEETLPAQLSKDSPDTIGYNISAAGYGPSELLLRAQDGDSLADIHPEDGIGVYALLYDHPARFTNSAFMAGTWRHSGLTLNEVSPGRFTSRGPIRLAEPMWFWFAKIWSASALTRLSGTDLPLLTSARLDQMVRVIKALGETYQRKTALTNPFIVAILPSSSDMRPIRAALDRGKVPFIDYSRVNVPARLSGPFSLPGEIHPTPEALALIAQAMKRDLQN